VNYSVDESKLEIDAKNKRIASKIHLNKKVSSVMEYFEIFMERMIMSQKAAEFLGCKFELYINGSKIL